MMMPKGLDQAHRDVVLDLMSWMLQPKQQAYNYDDGYFYPGPAIKNVPISLAPQHSQDVIKQFGRPEYDTIIQQVKVVLPLGTNQIVSAFNTWDKQIGGGKYKSS